MSRTRKQRIGSCNKQCYHNQDIRRVTNTNELPYPQSPGNVGFLWGPIVTKRKTISW
jgi:hypothetical protein